MAGCLTAWAGADFVADLPEVTVLVHAIVGEHDPALGEATMPATWMEQLAGCELTVLGNAGHYAMFETPVALVGRWRRRSHRKAEAGGYSRPTRPSPAAAQHSPVGRQSRVWKASSQIRCQV